MKEIQAEVLFGNIEEVTALSRDLLTDLEETSQAKHSLVGGVFVTFAPRIKSVYAAYCRNHDNASALNEKVYEAPPYCTCLMMTSYTQYADTPAIAESIHQAMDILR